MLHNCAVAGKRRTVVSVSCGVGCCTRLSTGASVLCGRGGSRWRRVEMPDSKKGGIRCCCSMCLSHHFVAPAVCSRTRCGLSLSTAWYDITRKLGLVPGVATFFFLEVHWARAFGCRGRKKRSKGKHDLLGSIGGWFS